MYKTLKKYLIAICMVGLLIFLLRPTPKTNQKEYAIVEQHVTLADQCNMESLLWLYDFESYNEGLMSVREEQGALCGKLYFEIAFLKRYKESSFEDKYKTERSLLNEKKYVEQAKVLLKKMAEIDSTVELKQSD
jgi:hypothetical protein